MIEQDGPNQYSIPKIDPCEAGTCWCCSKNSVRASDGAIGAVRAGVGRVYLNKFGAKCSKCSEWIPALDGLLTKLPTGKFGAMHKNCHRP